MHTEMLPTNLSRTADSGLLLPDTRIWTPGGLRSPARRTWISLAAGRGLRKTSLRGCGLLPPVGRGLTRTWLQVQSPAHSSQHLVAGISTLQVHEEEQPLPGTRNFLETAQFVDNPDPRALFVLLVDTSTTMHDSGAIDELNEGLKLFHTDLMEDPLARRRSVICVVSFGYNGVKVIVEPIPAAQFSPPTLQAYGLTPMGEGIMVTLDLIQNWKEALRRKAPYYRPTVCLICDGDPTDEWRHASARVRAEEEQGKVAWFSVGVEGANMDLLGQVSHRRPKKLKGFNFRELFLWLSNSQKRLSNSKPGDQVSLPPTDEWSRM